MGIRAIAPRFSRRGNQQVPTATDKGMVAPKPAPISAVRCRQCCGCGYGRVRLWTAPLVNVSYGGLAFRARRADKWPPRGKGEIVRLPLERRTIRIRALHSVTLPGGAVRVGCAYV